MQCCNCKADLPEESLFCCRCGTKQVLPALPHAGTDARSLLPTNPIHSVAKLDSFQGYETSITVRGTSWGQQAPSDGESILVNIALETRHQETLIQFREELRKQSSQTKKLDRVARQQSVASTPNDPVTVKLPIYIKALIIILSLILIVEFVWSLRMLPNGDLQSNVLTLGSAVLTFLGTLYLAYDLLKRRHNFLQTLTSFASYWLIGVLIFEPCLLFLLLVLHDEILPRSQDDLFVLLVFILFAGLMSACISMLVGIPPKPGSESQRFSWRNALTGGLLWGLLYALTLTLIIFINRSFEHDYVSILATPVLIIGGAIIGGFRYRLTEPSETTNTLVHSFSKKGCLSGIVAGIVMMVSLYLYFIITFTISHEEFTIVNFLIFPLVMSAPSVIIGGIAGAFARYINWKTSKLGTNMLGAFGLLLILLAVVFQCIIPVLHIYQVR